MESNYNFIRRCVLHLVQSVGGAGTLRLHSSSQKIMYLELICKNRSTLLCTKIVVIVPITKFSNCQRKKKTRAQFHQSIPMLNPVCLLARHPLLTLRQISKVCSTIYSTMLSFGLQGSTSIWVLSGMVAISVIMWSKVLWLTLVLVGITKAVLRRTRNQSDFMQIVSRSCALQSGGNIWCLALIRV